MLVSGMLVMVGTLLLYDLVIVGSSARRRHRKRTQVQIPREQLKEPNILRRLQRIGMNRENLHDLR